LRARTIAQFRQRPREPNFSCLCHVSPVLSSLQPPAFRAVAARERKSIIATMLRFLQRAPLLESLGGVRC
jgi:hypothetical protein